MNATHVAFVGLFALLAIALAAMAWRARRKRRMHPRAGPREGAAVLPRRQERQQARRKARRKAKAAPDPLPGINNRRAFFEQAQAMGARETLGGRLVAWLMIDIDTFKVINVRHGSSVGDAILRQVADALRDTLRGSDVAGHLGGDTFCALLFDVQPGAAALRAERLRQRIEAQSVGGNGEVVMATVSIGVAHARWDRRIDLDALMAAADRRLQAARRGGRNRVVASDIDAVPVAKVAPPPAA